MNSSQLWQGVIERDQALDGRVVYAVTTTGIYCRPSCPSRKPRREHARFYSLPRLAEAAGFRACRRCDPASLDSADPQVALVAQVCRLLDEAVEEGPSLAELGQHFHISPHHLQRLFTRVVGISPQAYLGARRMDALRERLREGTTIGEAIYAVGFSSSSQLYSRSDDELGMTPGDYRKGGEGRVIGYSVTPTTLGLLLVAGTERGLCAVRLGDDEQSLVEEFITEFEEASLVRDDAALRPMVEAILPLLAGRAPHEELPLDVQATAFQRQVWAALRAIPRGETRSYAQIAEAIGRPGAVRAVGTACGRNPIAVVVPCHRVVRSDGTMGGYRWGVGRKEQLLQAEREARDERG